MIGLENLPDFGNPKIKIGDWLYSLERILMQHKDSLVACMIYEWSQDVEDLQLPAPYSSPGEDELEEDLVPFIITM